MISRTLDFDEFVQAVKDRSLVQIVAFAQSEIYEAETLGYGLRDRDEIKARTAGAYASLLKGLVFWLTFGQKSASVGDPEFRRMRRLGEVLAARGQLRPAALAAFG